MNMNKILFYSIITIVIFGFIYNCKAEVSTEEKPQLTFDGRVWGIGYQAQNYQGSIIEYVLGGETTNNWTELVTVQSFKGTPENTKAENIMEKIKQNLKSLCPDIKFTVFYKKQNDLLYEWSITDCPRDKDQHEIARILLGKNGLHIIHYVTKKVPISPKTRQQWIKLIKAANLCLMPSKEDSKVKNNIIPQLDNNGLFYSSS
jgi:hypothetical protein